MKNKWVRFKFLRVSLLSLLFAVLSILVFEATSYVQEDGVLHEWFILVGLAYIFSFLGIVFFSVSFIHAGE